MNQKAAKQIRSIIPPNDPVSRRNYRRAKKKYSRLPALAKPLFMIQLAEMLNASH
jgi:hypothetical protein